MHELERVLAACRRSMDSGRPAMLATVVRVEGSAYRRPGARMVLIAGEEPIGMISGGCLESDLVERLEAAAASGRPELVVYDMRSPDDIVWGLGLGCNGEIRVLLEPLSPGSPPAYLEFLDCCEREREPGVLVTVFAVTGGAGIEAGDRLALDAAGSFREGPRRDELARWFGAAALDAQRERRSTVHVRTLGDSRAEALVEYLAPVPVLAVFGAGSDAVPVTRLAREIGWRVHVLDHRPAWARPERFPGAVVHTVDYERLVQEPPVPIDEATAAIVMTHHFLNDLALLMWLVDTPAPYIGLLGPRRRALKLFEELAPRGRILADVQRARIYGPIGLDLGAESPEEIALAAVAEIRAVLGGRSGGFLRGRTRPLHEPSAARRENP